MIAVFNYWYYTGCLESEDEEGPLCLGQADDYATTTEAQQAVDNLEPEGRAYLYRFDLADKNTGMYDYLWERSLDGHWTKTIKENLPYFKRKHL